MKYRELLELYKEEELSEEQMRQIENDIEKQEAISDYLFDREEDDCLKMGGLEEPLEKGKETKEAEKADEFTKLVNRKIRRAFLKFGAIVSAVTLVLVLVAVSVVPKIADKIYTEYAASENAKYYNPGEMIGEHTNQMSLDMHVYAEALLPLVIRDNVNVDEKGFGNYDIYIPQNLSYTGRFNNVAGEINQGKLVLYDSNVFTKPSDNVFAWAQIERKSSDSLTTLIDEKGQMNTSAAGSRESAMNALYDLNENTMYQAYVTLNQVLSYEEFIEFQENTNIKARWCAVCTSPKQLWNFGFTCTLAASSFLEFDNEKYPDLIAWQDSVETIEVTEENFKSETFMKQHFISMMNYLADQEDFMEMMGEDIERYEAAAEYVEENGLMIYGYVVMGEKADLIQLAEENQEMVYQIYAREMQ